MKASFAQRVLGWFDYYGRKNLPWQQQVTPYRVWISEIMLQQTRVETVIPYFERFMQRFPGVEILANAAADEVMHYWSGLGYYARARNLHQAAQIIVEKRDGKFPEDIDALCELPGIGRSTAGAIVSLSMGKRATILDGNVKRVLIRHAGIEGWAGQTATLHRLWELAEERTPHEEFAAYNQAMMDLGATLCTRSKPFCENCPINSDCVARAQHRQHELPMPKPKKVQPTRQVSMLLLRNKDNEILLTRRMQQGIWGGLWGLPEFTDTAQARQWCLTQFGNKPASFKDLPQVPHTFSHFHLEISPVLAEYHASLDWVMEEGQWLWYNGRSTKVGLAAPVSRLIASIE